MSGKPTVSVIIPTFNRPQLLLRAVNSVLKQTYSKFEIIIIDDCSDVDIQSKIEKLADGRIKYVRHSKRLGGAFARNTGIKSARGQFVAFLDDDDEWLPTKLEKQVEKFSESSVDIGVVYCGFRAVCERETAYEIRPKWRGNISRVLFKKCCIGSPTPLIRKSCLEDVHYFDTGLPSCQDWDLWIRLSMKYAFDFIPEVLAIYHIHGKQISVDIEKKIVGRESILKKYYHELKKHKKILSWHYRRLGSLNCLSRNYRDGLKYFIYSIVTNPLNGGSYAHLLLFFLSRFLHQRLIYRYGTKKVGGITIIS